MWSKTFSIVKNKDISYIYIWNNAKSKQKKNHTCIKSFFFISKKIKNLNKKRNKKKKKLNQKTSSLKIK